MKWNTRLSFKKQVMEALFPVSEISTETIPGNWRHQNSLDLVFAERPSANCRSNSNDMVSK